MQVLDHISKFLKECGLIRYNRYLLPIVSFIRMCVGMSEEDYEELIRGMGLLEVLYTAEQIVELNAPKVSGGTQ